MTKVIRREIRQRGFFGHIFKWGFILFNCVMAFWLFWYWGEVGHMTSGATSDAARTGTVIGATIGSGLIVFFWAAGALILGLFALLTRGKTIVIEETSEA